VNRHSLYEKTLLKRGCSIGANATIVCGVTVGRYAFIGAGTVVNKDVPDYSLMVGNPARKIAWVSRHGQRLSAPDAEGVMRCPESGLRYKETAGVLKCPISMTPRQNDQGHENLSPVWDASHEILC
jgi:UDP-2-acetamido-3-amino-2,3-dideoxy-glucuronate N-acetyltransferase